MKTDPRIIISIDKQFYSDDDEIRIHVWFNHAFYSPATLTVLSPTGRKIDSSGLKTMWMLLKRLRLPVAGLLCLRMEIM